MRGTHRVVSVLVLALVALAGAAVVGGCQSAPQVAPQRGPDGGAQTSPISPSAPVDQHGVLIVSPTVVMSGPTAPDGKLPTVTITVGPQANGDVKGLGKQEGGAQTSSNTTTQSSSPTQDVSPESVAKAAGELLATAAPGSDAAKLAQAAIDAARAGDAAKAKELLGKAAAANVTAHGASSVLAGDGGPGTVSKP
jgi:hypothetical protein